MSKPPNPFVALAEKAISTYVQALALALVASSFFEDVFFEQGRALSFGKAAVIAAIPAAVTVVANGVSAAVIPADLPHGVQAALRVLRTGVAGGLGYIVAIPVESFGLTAEIGQAAWAAGALALTAALKAEIGTYFGDRGNVSWLPVTADQTGAAA